MAALPPPAPLAPPAPPAPKRGTPRWTVALGAMGPILGIGFIAWAAWNGPDDSSTSSRSGDERACDAFAVVQREGNRRGSELNDMIEVLDAFEAALDDANDTAIRSAGEQFLTIIWNRGGGDATTAETRRSGRRYARGVLLLIGDSTTRLCARSRSAQV